MPLVVPKNPIAVSEDEAIRLARIAARRCIEAGVPIRVCALRACGARGDTPKVKRALNALVAAGEIPADHRFPMPPSDEELLDSVRAAAARCREAGSCVGPESLRRHGARGDSGRLRRAIATLRRSGELPREVRRVHADPEVEGAVKAAALACVAAGRYPAYRRMRRFGVRGDNGRIRAELNRLLDSGTVVIPPGLKDGRSTKKVVEMAPPKVQRVRPKEDKTKFGKDVREILRAEKDVRKWRDTWVARQAMEVGA